MKLRWFVDTYKYSTWDDRWDVYRHHTSSKPPVLQMKVDGEWVDVPTFEHIEDERVKESD